jgi:hypothetical protein
MPKKRFGMFEKRIIIKLIIFFVLLLCIFFMDLMNLNIKEKNEKMIRFIKSEEQFKLENVMLKKRAKHFNKYYLKINKSDDLDNIKSTYMNKIIELFFRYKLRADSYNAQVKKKQDFVTFSFVVSAFGDYKDTIKLFIHMYRKHKYMYIKQFDLQKSGANLIRIDLSIDILGK